MKRKVVLWGAGNICGIARDALLALPSAEIVGVVDTSAAARQMVEQKWNVPAYPDGQAMMGALGKPDVGFLGVPSGARLDPAVFCLQNGIHTIAEKPLEITLERIEQCLQAAAASSARLFTVFQKVLDDGFQFFYETAKAGCFGDLVFADAANPWCRRKRYYFTDDSMEHRNWRGTWKLDGGGALGNQTIHELNGLLVLAGAVMGVPLGESPLAEDDGAIGGQVANINHPYIEVEDTALVSMRFRTGALGSLRATVSTHEKPGKGHITIAGTQGYATIKQDIGITEWEFDGETPVDDQVAEHMAAAARKTESAGASVDPKGIGHLLHLRMFEQIFTAIDSGDACLFDGVNGAVAARTACKFYEATNARDVLAG